MKKLYTAHEIQNIKTIQTSWSHHPYGGAQKRTKQATSSSIVSLVRTCFVFLAFVSANSMGLLQKLVHCPRCSSPSPNAALLARLKYEVSGIDSLPAGFLRVYQFMFCIVLWPCNQVMSWHSAPSSPSVPSHPTAFRTAESDDRQTRTVSSLCSSVRTLQIGFLEFTTHTNAFRGRWVPVTTT
jgi:hypothetical protein